MTELLHIHVFLIVLLANCNHVRSLEFRNCEGAPYGCCNGFMYNETLGECTECRIGYFGPMCTMACPYNSYGRGCQMECNCSEDDCDFALGCEKFESDVKHINFEEKSNIKRNYSALSKTRIEHMEQEL